MNPRDFIYDVETYPNFFSLAMKHVASGQRWNFEISDRRNDAGMIVDCLHTLKANNARMVGFNNIGFDYPVLHFIPDLLAGQCCTVDRIYAKSQEIINTPWDDRFRNRIAPYKHIVEQVDLMLVHHFDNVAKATSLKMLQFNMRSRSVEDLPFAPGSHLTHEQKDITLEYNNHDIDETEKFYIASTKELEFREELSRRYDRNFMNHNDTKIGKDYFVMQLEAAGIQCFHGREAIQTQRDRLVFEEMIFPYVKFEHPEFQRIHTWFKQRSVTETKAAIKDLIADVNDVEIKFGMGGIHGSLKNIEFETDEEYLVLDMDVDGYYPSVAMANRLYPEHLSDKFCDIYKGLKEERKKHAKTTVENGMLKLAMNGVWGDSNSKYGPFRDPKYAMTITINGQLMLCMLAEQLIKISKLIQMNTDGMTVYIKRCDVDILKTTVEWWEHLTGLTMEYTEYKRMFIRDVNNYIAEKMDGSLKTVGAYVYQRTCDTGNPKHLGWHQKQSALVIRKAAVAALIDNVYVSDFIRSHMDPFDFMLVAKIQRNHTLVWNEQEQQRTTRYYVANEGHELTKILPPLKGKTENRRIGINVGWKTQICNHARDFNGMNLNYDYYIAEATKLVKGIRK